MSECTGDTRERPGPALSAVPSIVCCLLRCLLPMSSSKSCRQKHAQSVVHFSFLIPMSLPPLPSPCRFQHCSPLTLTCPHCRHSFPLTGVQSFLPNAQQPASLAASPDGASPAVEGGSGAALLSCPREECREKPPVPAGMLQNQVSGNVYGPRSWVEVRWGETGGQGRAELQEASRWTLIFA